MKKQLIENDGYGRKVGLLLLDAKEVSSLKSHLSLANWHDMVRTLNNHGPYPEAPKGYESIAMMDRVIICAEMKDESTIEEAYKTLEEVIGVRH